MPQTHADTHLTREDLYAALFGFDVARREIAAREERFRQLLAGMEATVNGGRGNGRKIAAEPKQITAAAGVDNGPSEVIDTITTKHRKQFVYANDPERRYCHNPDGSFKLTVKGFPKPNSKAAHNTRRHGPIKRTVGKTSVPASGIKMEYHPDGSPMYRANADGSVKLTAVGKPWRLPSGTALHEAALKSHIARGLQPAKG